jgi:hypothetical protein
MEGKSMSITAVFQRGEDFYVGIELLTGDVAEVASVVSNAKTALPGNFVPPSNMLEAFDWIVTPRAASGDIGAGWDMRLPAATSEAVQIGTYVSTIEFNLTNGGKDRWPAFYFRVDEVTL